MQHHITFTDWLPDILDKHQCLPLMDSDVAPAFRAIYLPTFHHNVLLTLRCPDGLPATLTVISTENFETSYYNPLSRRRGIRPGALSKKQRRRAQRRRSDPESPPLSFPWPLAWWVLPGTRRESHLFQRSVSVSDDALARWQAALAGVELLLEDAPMDNGRDGMATIAEVLLPHGAAAFSAWHPEAGTPWQRYFTAMLDLCEVGCDDPLIAQRLAELRRYQ